MTGVVVSFGHFELGVFIDKLGGELLVVSLRNVSDTIRINCSRWKVLLDSFARFFVAVAVAVAIERVQIL